MSDKFSFLKIANLEGIVKSFGFAADLNQDGKIDVKELSVFNRLIAEAGFNMDDGLVVEREAASERGKNATSTELAKQEDKMYKECFGFKAGSADLANFKNQVAQIDNRVISVLKQLQDAGDTEKLAKLNNIIANRPDMTNYIGNSVEYLRQLDDSYANAAEALLKQSDREFISQEVQGAASALADLNIALSEDLKNHIDQDTIIILKAYQDGKAEILDQIKDSEGNIVKTIRSSEGRICKVIENAKGEIILATILEGAKTRHTVRVEGAKTRNTVRETALDTQNVVREEGAETRNVVKRQAQETQVLESMREGISDMLQHNDLKWLGAGFRDKTVKWIGDAADRVMADSELSFNEKKAALNELEQMVKNERIISDGDKKKFEDKYFNDIRPHDHI